MEPTNSMGKMVGSESHCSWPPGAGYKSAVRSSDRANKYHGQVDLPESWVTTSTMFFVLGSVAMGLLAIVSVAMLWVLLDLRKMLQGITGRVNSLADKADHIAANIKDVTDEVGTRTRGIARIVDDHANTAFAIVEKVAPIFIAIGIVSKIAKLIRSRS